MDVTSAQVIAFRLAAQGVGGGAGTPHDVLGAWTVQDSPPGAATAAVLARTTGDGPVPGWLDAAIEDSRTVVALYNARTATAILPAGEAPAFAAAIRPGDDDKDLKAVVGPALPALDHDYAPAVRLAVNAISEALDGVVLSRDALHEALRQTLPPNLLPWCPGCKSHHARRGLLVMASLRGRLCLAGRAGRQPAFARTDQWTGWDEPAAPGGELARRYLRAYGPSTRQHFAHWAGLSTAHAKRLWTSIADELLDVRIDGKQTAQLLATDRDALTASANAPTGVQLLGPGDPVLLGRDRERLVPDAAVRKRVWAAIGGAGLVIDEGRVQATWRGRKRGTTLELTLSPLDGARLDTQAITTQGERLAPHRGATAVAVQLTDR